MSKTMCQNPCCDWRSFCTEIISENHIHCIISNSDLRGHLWHIVVYPVLGDFTLLDKSAIFRHVDEIHVERHYRSLPFLSDLFLSSRIPKNLPILFFVI